MKAKTAHTVLYGIRIFLMVFWLYVALDKLWNLEAFYQALLRQPVPNWWADVLYWSLPLAELGIALFFLTSPAFSASDLPDKRITKTTRQKNPRHSEEGSDVRIWGFWGSLPFLLSALLMLVFTLYIALGVAGLYAERPCGCASVFNGLSWGGHLLVNGLLLAISILGWHLTGPTAPIEKQRNNGAVYHTRALLFPWTISWIPIHNSLGQSFKRLFPRRFAPFPAGPVWNKL